MAAMTTEDLRTAYLLGRGANNELTPDMLQQKGWPSEKVLKVINALVEKRLCVYHKNKATGKVRVKVREEQVAQAIRTLASDDYAVYCAIEDAGSTGAWTLDICRSSGLQSHVVQRAVKNLHEVKKLIKPLKSIHQRNRKIYILAHLEPSKEIVGGTFYDNAEFDEGLVQRLRDQIIHVLKNGSKSTLSDISNYIRSSGFGKDLSDDDLKLVLATLQLEQQIACSISPGTGELVYVWCRWTDSNILGMLPCAHCPVADECIRQPGSRVSPDTCKYYDYWLNYETDFQNIPPQETTTT